MLKYYSEISKLLEENTSFVNVILTNIKGSAPQEIGAKMLCDKNGLLFGTVGGGKIEAKCIEYAKNLLEKNNEQNFYNSLVKIWDLQKDVGMTCGGKVWLFFELYNFNKKWEIAIFGAGHIAQELVPLLSKLDCNLTCIDHRQEWLDKIDDNSNLSKKLINEDDYENVAYNLKNKNYVISVSQGHAKDLPILKGLLTYYTENKIKPTFLGVIGSDSKLKKLKKDLQNFNIDSKLFPYITCPLGLKYQANYKDRIKNFKVGKNIPVEIAVSITAQLLMIRDKNLNE